MEAAILFAGMIVVYMFVGWILERAENVEKALGVLERREEIQRKEEAERQKFGGRSLYEWNAWRRKRKAEELGLPVEGIKEQYPLPEVPEVSRVDRWCFYAKMVLIVAYAIPFTIAGAGFLLMVFGGWSPW